jgi:hypothetical protein
MRPGARRPVLLFVIWEDRHPCTIGGDCPARIRPAPGDDSLLANTFRLSETVSHLGLSVLRVLSDRFASSLVVVSLGGQAGPHLAREP